MVSTPEELSRPGGTNDDARAIPGCLSTIPPPCAGRHAFVDVVKIVDLVTVSTGPAAETRRLIGRSDQFPSVPNGDLVGCPQGTHGVSHTSPADLVKDFVEGMAITNTTHLHFPNRFRRRTGRPDQGS